MKFSVRNGNIKFNAEFFGKYSIISGDSAIGKTTLYNFLHDAEDGIIGYEIQIDTPYHVLDKRESAEDIRSFKDTLLIADETCKLLHLPNTATALKESNNRFLIISRTVPSFLPLGVKNLYTLSSVAGVYNLVPVLSNSGYKNQGFNCDLRININATVNNLSAF